jgi:hypothetical protein
LIAYARAASPYYARRYRKLPADASLTDLPPVTKSDLMDNFDEVVTRPELTRRDVEAFVAGPDRIGRTLAGRYSVWTSSGTTEPGLFVHDPDALAVYDALEAQRFRGLRSPTDLLRQLIEGDRYAMVAATDGHFAGVATVERMRNLAPWMANAVRAFALLQPCAQLVEQLNGRYDASRPIRLLPKCWPRSRRRVDSECDHARSGPVEKFCRSRHAYVSSAHSIAGAQRLRRIGISADCLGVPNRRLHVNSDWSCSSRSTAKAGPCRRDRARTRCC